MSEDQQRRPEATGFEEGGPTEDDLRAAYEAQVKQLRVEHVLLDNVVTLANLGMRRTGLAPGTEDERDPDQVRLAIESIRALLPVLEQTAPSQVAPIRDALSQLQLAFIRIGGHEAAPSGDGPAGGAPRSGEPAQADAGAEADARAEAEKPAAAEKRAAGEPPAGEPAAAKPGEPGPAQRSGRLWVPGQ